jgi:AraC-like DNA-binding protein
VGNVWVENQWLIKNCYCLGKPYGSVWKMPTLENSYSTEPGIGNLSILIANDIPDDFSQDTVMKFRQLRGKMFNSLNEKWTISRMAKETNFGESHFQHLYKKLYGISPTADLINERMIKAKHLLTYETISIVKIAATLGYENSTHFTRQFKKEVGMSPAKYRSSANMQQF